MKCVVLVFTGAMALYPATAFAQSDDENAKEVIANPDEVTCERRSTPGSRARRVRICMTNAEWEMVRRQGNADARTIQDDATRIGVRDGSGIGADDGPGD